MNEQERKVLKALAKHAGFADANAISESIKIGINSLMSMLSRLSDGGLVEMRKEEQNFASLTSEGALYAAVGLPERRLANRLEKGKVDFSGMPAELGMSPAEAQLALQWALKRQWAKAGKEEGRTVVSALKAPAETEEEKLLLKLKEGGKIPFAAGTAFSSLKARNLLAISAEKKVSAKITEKGRDAMERVSDEIAQLTPQMIREGSWKDLKLKEYELKSILQPSPAAIGKKHFYLQFVRELKEQLVSLGFQEAEGPFTELEFWNMDALFMPQDHPARDIHDVFQLDLQEGKLPGKKIVEGVRKAHEKGVGGSKGWGYEWDPERAARVVLRSQTTAVSARMLAAGITPPLKMFCVGKVFRPDEVDWKHFIEFSQCEGIVADEGMDFRELLGYLRTFAIDIFGAKPAEVKFAPSYFPFTEPSVELMVRINGKWTEAGGAGIFRPEMLLPLQCKVPVLAWGLGLDRLAMLHLQLKDIRELFSQDLRFLRGK